MYAFIETIYFVKFQKKFDCDEFKKYANFEEFRLLNNIFKHQKKKEVEVSFVKIVHINQKQFDLLCSFQYQDSFKSLMYSAFIILFLTILKDMGIIVLKN